MKPSTNVCGTTAKIPSKRAIKKQINIPWNSRIFFQVGLIVSLLTAFFVMELEITKAPIAPYHPNDVAWEAPIRNIHVLKDKVTPPKKEHKKIAKRTIVKTTTSVISQKFVQAPDDSNIKEVEIAPSDTPVIATPLVPAGIDKSPLPATANIIGVEHVPIFPGCEGAVGKTAKIECMSSKIKAFIGSRFDTGDFDYFEPGSVQTIHTMFTIDVEGNIVDIKAMASDKKLEDEAKRVISKLPLIQPGRQGDTKVNVTYSVPIHFQVNN